MSCALVGNPILDQFNLSSSISQDHQKFSKLSGLDAKWFLNAKLAAELTQTVWQCWENWWKHFIHISQFYRDAQWRKGICKMLLTRKRWTFIGTYLFKLPWCYNFTKFFQYTGSVIDIIFSVQLLECIWVIHKMILYKVQWDLDWDLQRQQWYA